MVITSLQEKENRKFYVPIRPGNRGGWSLFEWQSVRQMPYRDREMYLGNSAVIGVLDKGGKWRKRDWYLKTQKKYNDPNLTSQQQQAIRKDMERMNAALGNSQMDDEQQLTEQEMKQLLKKIKNKDNEYQPAKDAVGLGFDKTKVQIRAKPTTSQTNVNRLQQINELGLGDQVKQQKRKQKKEKRHREQSQISRSREKKSKKQKKDKKHKRDRQRSPHNEKEGKHRQRSRSRSKDKKSKKEKHKKHRHDRSRSRD